MKIGIMLRALDEKGGIGVYTRYITEELLAIDRRNQYFLFYKTAANLGRYAHQPNVTESCCAVETSSGGIRFWSRLPVCAKAWTSFSIPSSRFHSLRPARL